MKRPYDSKIPEARIDPQEVSKMMRVNVDILKREIEEEVNKAKEEISLFIGRQLQRLNNVIGSNERN